VGIKGKEFFDDPTAKLRCDILKNPDDPRAVVSPTIRRGKDDRGRRGLGLGEPGRMGWA
jgi:hypothetical protein